MAACECKRIGLRRYPEEKSVGVAFQPSILVPKQDFSSVALVATENNREYLPADYGVDAFSKVTTEIELTKKVVLNSGYRVGAAQIDEDGYWAGELIDTRLFTTFDAMFFSLTSLKSLGDTSNWDTSSATSMSSMFSNCQQLQQLDTSNWDTSSVTNMLSMFRDCHALQQVDTSSWDTSSVTNMSEMFRNCQQLQQLDKSNWDTSSATSMSNMFRDCHALQQVDTSSWDASKVTSIGDIFTYCRNLVSIIGGRTIDEVISNNIGCLNGLNISVINMFAGGNVTQVDRASLRALINGLADRTGQSTLILTLGATLIAKLTEDDIAIATNKNWTIA